MQILNDLHQIGSHLRIEALRHNFSCGPLHCRWLLLLSCWVAVRLGKESRCSVLFWRGIELWMLGLLGKIAGASVFPGLFTQVLNGLGLSFKVEFQFGQVQCNLIFFRRFYNLYIIIGPWLFIDSWQVVVVSGACVCWKLLLACCLGLFLGWVVDWVCKSVGASWCIGLVMTAFVIIVFL